MRILHWSELFWPDVGGVEVFSAALIPALQQRGHEFLAVSSHGSLDLPDEEVHGGIHIRRFPFRSSLEAKDLARIVEIQRQVAALKRAFRPSVVHVHGIGPSVFFHLRTAGAHQASTLLTMISEVVAERGAPDTLTGRTLRAADWVACVAEEIREQVLRWVPELGRRCSVVRNSVPLPTLSPRPLSWTPPRLLCVGRLVPDKGFDVALAAFALIADRFPEVRLVVAGDGPSRAALERQTAELGLAERVDFAGWVEPRRVWDLIDDATVVLMPSRREGLPLVALQAARIGRPIVGSRVGGLPEIVRHGETGLLVEKDDPRALAEAIVFLLQHPDRAAALALGARVRSRELPHWDDCVGAYDSLYRRLAWTGASLPD